MNDFRPLVIEAKGTQIGVEQRVRVQGSKNMTLLSDFFIFEVYNIASTDLSLIKDSKMLYAYGVNKGLICCGEVDEIYTRAEGVNTVTTVSVVDGKSFWDTKVSRSFGGGSSISTTFRNIIKNASIGAFVADDVRLIRGQTYSGRLADAVSELAKTAHGRAYITNNSVFVTAKGRAAEVIRIGEDDIVDDRNSAKGLRIIKTVMKGYPVGALVDLNGKKYRLVSQKINADNYKGAWDSILVLVDESELPTNGMEGG